MVLLLVGKVAQALGSLLIISRIENEQNTYVTSISLFQNRAISARKN